MNPLNSPFDFDAEAFRKNCYLLVDQVTTFLELFTKKTILKNEQLRETKSFPDSNSLIQREANLDDIVLSTIGSLLDKELLESYKNVPSIGTDKSIDLPGRRELKAIMGVIGKNMSDPHFNVENLTKEMGVSKSTLNRKIKNITGFHPSDLLRTIRLKKAAILLLNQRGSVCQISLAVGFKDHSNFTKSFKKQFGIAPSEYVQSKSVGK